MLENTFFSTGLSKLDEMMGGGIAIGHISTIRGATGSGKTMLSSSILSSVKCPVLHFLTEDKEPRFISVDKENYTFVVVDNADDIRIKIINAWNNGFAGIIAIDSIDRMNFDKASNPCEYSKMMNSWFLWFLSKIKECAKESRLSENASSMLITKQIKIQDGFSGGEQILCSGSSGFAHMTSQQLDVQIKDGKISTKMSKNRFAPVSSDVCEFEFDNKGIK